MGNKDMHNPIDESKVTSTPGLLPYAHSVGSAIIRPIDEGRTKGLSMKAMYQQTDKQLQQIKQQVELLIAQAQTIHDRISISESIYTAECRFNPLIGHTYHLYSTTHDTKVLSMIAPDEWGKRGTDMIYEATVHLLADHTWEVLEVK